jgi:KRAB domain-containing zinc finger protein
MVPRCDESFQRIENFTKHSEECEETSECPTCGISFDLKETFEKHLKLQLCHDSFAIWPDLKEKPGKSLPIVNSEEVNEHKCPYCAEPFMCNEQLRQHLFLHLPYDQRHVCSYCGKSFYDKSYFVRHKQKHIGEEKPFSCDICSKSFSEKVILKAHMGVHSNGPPFLCEICLLIYMLPKKWRY